MRRRTPHAGGTSRGRRIRYGACMTLDYSIASIMNRLAAWSGFPKYQLERRVDIFLTPFLESFVTAKLGRPAVLVAPEFPILADLRDNPNRPRQQLSGRTVNVDYLFHLPGEMPGWSFLELKTDARSFDAGQALLYAIAKNRGMRELLEDLKHVRELTERCHRPKYEVLVSAMASLAGSLDGPIRVAYLAPSALSRAVQESGVDHFFSLESFTDRDFAGIPSEHAALWPYVRDLLRSIGTA